MDYKKYFCPVCKENFKDGDDVVVCPDCGTAHHRNCWFEKGHCFNQDKHGTDEEIANNFCNSQEEEKEEKIVFNKNANSSQTDESTININNPQIDFNPSQSFLIEGRESVYYEIAVKKNQKYYLPHFIALSEINKKMISWNMAAFFVPFAWSVYRKMYKISALMFALYTLILGITGFYYFNDTEMMEISQACFEEDPNYAQNILAALTGQDVALTENQQKYIEEVAEDKIPSAVSVITSAALIAVRIFMGLKANRLYMNSINKTIRKGESLGYEGDRLKMYIYRKKGTFPFILAVIIGFYEWMMFYN